MPINAQERIYKSGVTMSSWLESVMREAVPSVVNRDFNYNQVDSKFRGELKSNPGKTAVLLGFVTTPQIHFECPI